MREAFVRHLAVMLFLFCICSWIASAQAAQIKTEYLYLTVSGNDMAPAICDGDKVKIKICANGTLIEAGSKDSLHPGDIIVYCAAAAVANPPSMWMCGRAVLKYWKDGEWCFRTQLDSNPEPNEWEVPEHYLLGVVAEVTPGIGPSSSALPSRINSLLELVGNFITGIIVGAIIALLLTVAHGRKRKRSIELASSSPMRQTGLIHMKFLQDRFST